MTPNDLSRIATLNPYENPNHALLGRDIELARAHVVDTLTELGITSLTIENPAGVEAPVRKHGVIVAPKQITFAVSRAATAVIEMDFEQPVAKHTHRLQLFRPDHPHDLPSGAYFRTTKYNDGEKGGSGEHLTCGDRAILGACLGALTLAKEAAQADEQELSLELLTPSA